MCLNCKKYLDKLCCWYRVEIIEVANFEPDTIQDNNHYSQIASKCEKCCNEDDCFKQVKTISDYNKDIKPMFRDKKILVELFKKK